MVESHLYSAAYAPLVFPTSQGCWWGGSGKMHEPDGDIRSHPLTMTKLHHEHREGFDIPGILQGTCVHWLETGITDQFGNFVLRAGIVAAIEDCRHVVAEWRMLAKTVLNASTTAASGLSFEISSAAEVVSPTSRPRAPNGFTQLISIFPSNGPASERASPIAAHGTARNTTSP